MMWCGPFRVSPFDIRPSVSMLDVCYVFGGLEGVVGHSCSFR